MLLLASPAARGAEPEKSVIQITTFSQLPFWDAPWRFDAVRGSSGSGFVISRKRIMTNAHVVSWAKQILVRRFQDPRPFVARVKFISHEADLAILEPEDPTFFDGLEALEIGDLPEVRSTVVTIGYPAGGEQISYTRGVVSRIEMQPYSHSGNRAYLACQTDAAINPGNSGGPAIQDDKVVGVAFQGIPGLENAGFFIATTLVRHFLEDIEDGTYDGFPQAGVRLVGLQNPAYRRFLKLPDNDLGARIDHIFDFEETRKRLKLEDVLLKVGDFPVASDGTILYRGNRLSVGVLFAEYQSGESVPLKVWRDGAELDVELPVRTYAKDRREGNQYDVLPRYHIFGGLVFVPLSRDYLRGVGGGGASDPGGAALVYELFYRRHEKPEEARSEPIVLASVLAHAVNANFSVRGRVVVDKVNGKRVDNMDDLIAAFEAKPEGGNHFIEFLPGDAFEAISAAEAAEAGPEILKSYGVPSDRRL